MSMSFIQFNHISTVYREPKNEHPLELRTPKVHEQKGNKRKINFIPNSAEETEKEIERSRQSES